MQRQIISQSYGAEDAYAILRERAKHAFHPGTVPEPVLRKAGEMAAVVHDIRFGFNLLLTAAINAEASNKQQIQLEDLARLAVALNEPKQLNLAGKKQLALMGVAVCVRPSP